MTENSGLKNSIMWLKFLGSSGARLLGCKRSCCRLIQTPVAATLIIYHQGRRRELLSVGQTLRSGLGGRGTPTTPTKSLDLHDYHNYHQVDARDPRTPPAATAVHYTCRLEIQLAIMQHETSYEFCTKQCSVLVIQTRRTVKTVDDVDGSPPTREYVYNNYRNLCNDHTTVSTSKHLKVWVIKSVQSVAWDECSPHPADTSVCQRNKVG